MHQPGPLRGAQRLRPAGATDRCPLLLLQLLLRLLLLLLLLRCWRRRRRSNGARALRQRRPAAAGGAAAEGKLDRRARPGRPDAAWGAQACPLPGLPLPLLLACTATCARPCCPQAARPSRRCSILVRDPLRGQRQAVAAAVAAPIRGTAAAAATASLPPPAPVALFLPPAVAAAAA